MNKKAKKSYFMNTTKTPKHFWDAIKPKFSDKSCVNDGRIQLLENDILYTSDNQVADIFNSYFNRITENLDIPSWAPQNP